MAFLGKSAPRRSRIAVSVIEPVLNYCGQHIARLGCVLLTHQNLKARAGPRNVFAHSPDSVGLSHCRNTSSLERALSQLRLSAATERLDDNKLGVVHDVYCMPALGPDSLNFCR
jgi:hypothetical protein